VQFISVAHCESYVAKKTHRKNC